MRTAIVGCGVVGGAMARRLLSLGHEVAVFDVREEVVADLVTRGAQGADSGAAAVASADFVILSLPREEDVRASFSGPNGILAGLTGGEVILEASTVPRQVVVDLDPLVRARGAMLLDTPICPAKAADDLQDANQATATETKNRAGVAAEAGLLCFFVGGDSAAVAKAGPLLEALSTAHHHVGPIGSGKVVKLIHNAINLATLALISEMLIAGRAFEVDVPAAVSALRDSLADSRILRSHVEGYIAKQHFPMGLFPVDYVLKDLEYALEMARSAGSEASILSAAVDLYAGASSAGWGEFYSPAIYRYIESLHNT